MSSTTDFPPGIWYLSKITETNHAGYVWIVALLTLLYPLGACFVRFNVRYGAYRSDDWGLAAATVFSVLEHIPLFIALRKGLGKLDTVLSDPQRYSVDKALYAAQFFFIMAHCAAKLSLALCVRRLFNSNQRLTKVLCWSLIGLTSAWGILSMFILLIGCSPLQSYAGAGHCAGEIARWRAVTALDILTELAIVAVPSYLVSSVLIRSGAKIIVISTFASRLPVIALTVIHMFFFRKAVEASDVGFAYLSPVIWIQVLLAWSLFSASIPAFRAFMQPFDTVHSEIDGQTYSGGRSHNNGAYLMMGPMKMPKNARNILQPTGLETQISVAAKKHKHQHSGPERTSWASQEGIIRKNVVWNITSDPMLE
ncbi:hypothetical protein MBLNU459_g7143t1 [Dothideomycetes sp. NU459]